LAFALAFFFAAMCVFTPFLEKVNTGTAASYKNLYQNFPEIIFRQNKFFWAVYPGFPKFYFSFFFCKKIGREECSSPKIKALISSLP